MSSEIASRNVLSITGFFSQLQKNPQNENEGRFPQFLDIRRYDDSIEVGYRPARRLVTTAFRASYKYT